jgi:hypothetical protein
VWELEVMQKEQE